MMYFKALIRREKYEFHTNERIKETSYSSVSVSINSGDRYELETLNKNE